MKMHRFFLISLVILFPLPANSGQLIVTLIDGKVPDRDTIGGKTDTYVQLWLRSNPSNRFKSKTVGGSLTPTFNQEFRFGSDIGPQDVVEFEAKDDDVGSDDKLGQGSFPVSHNGLLERTIWHDSKSSSFRFSVSFVQDNPCGTDEGSCGQYSKCIFQGQDGQRKCQCQDGYTSIDGTHTDCTWINPCSHNNGKCGINTICVHTGPNLRTCECDVGYSRKGDDCQPIDPCLKHPTLCGPNASCQFDGPDTYKCHCDAGFEHNESDSFCHEINFCQKIKNGGCGNYSSCAHVSPGVRICPCRTGFRRLNSSSSFEEPCFPIDICQDDPDICGNHSTCITDGPGLHYCQCEIGYELSKDSDFCQPINACSSSPCGQHSTCIVSGPNRFKCQCEEGYEKLEENDTSCYSSSVLESNSKQSSGEVAAVIAASLLGLILLVVVIILIVRRHRPHDKAIVVNEHLTYSNPIYKPSQNDNDDGQNQFGTVSEYEEMDAFAVSSQSNQQNMPSSTYGTVRTISSLEYNGSNTATSNVSISDSYDQPRSESLTLHDTYDQPRAEHLQSPPEDSNTYYSGFSQLPGASNL